MAHYVISDLHGEADRFHKLLDRINFTAHDTLYIVGDVVDRGPSGVELLTEVMASPNMVMTLGNHEHMCMQYFSPDATEQQTARWNRNGNTPTLLGFIAAGDGKKAEILEFINSLPTHLELEVEGRRFYLVHGWPGDNVHDEVWGRPAIDAENPVEGATLIVGHTPVSFVAAPGRENEYIAELRARGEHLRILHAPGFIDIDCLCGYLYLPERRLACLRLEDMCEFYI